MANVEDVIFRTFQTCRNRYVYDRHTNSIFAVSPIEFEEFRQVERGTLPWKKSAVIAKYQKEGMFVQNVVKKLHHPQTEIVGQNADRLLTQLILQVTQQCNLRCAYCAYSGIYEGNRTHSPNHMMFETAKKAVDFFFAHSIDNARVSIGFYGGEPLLEFDLIEKIVDYISQKNEGKKVVYGLTTNGTLLKGRCAKFLAENEFDIGISLDGSKTEHDACRKFPDGSGSFDVVIKNIEDLSRRYPEYTMQKVKFFTTVNPYMDLGCVLNYFDSSELIDNRNILYNTMVDVDLKDGVSYQESYYQIRNYEYVRMLFAMVGKIEDKYISRLIVGNVDQIDRLWKSVHRKKALQPISYQGGPCLPGILRLFVRYDGSFFPCERVNENLDYYKIGSVEDGFYFERIKALLNVGKLTEEECKNCWNLRHCLVCSNEIELHGKDKPEKEDKLQVCQGSRAATEFALYQLCVLKEFGYTPKTEVLWV